MPRLLRIGVGIFFLIFGQYKVFGTAFTLHWRLPILDQQIPRGRHLPIHGTRFCVFVLSHATRIAFSWPMAKFAIGLALVLGILVRSASSSASSSGDHAFLSDYPGAGAAFLAIFRRQPQPSVFVALLRRFPPRRAELLSFSESSFEKKTE